MNFIFDIGNVLIDFKPKAFLQALHAEPSDVIKINEVIFQSPEWIQLDQGIITQEDAARAFCAREPDYTQRIMLTMSRLTEMLTPIKDTTALLPALKAHGHRLYYLSNYHAKLRDYILAQYRFFDAFDGGVFSCDIHEIKPSPAIYQYLLKAYDINPSECLFIDDVLENVKSAENMGMMGHLLTSPEETGRYISRWLNV